MMTPAPGIRAWFMCTQRPPAQSAADHGRRRIIHSDHTSHRGSEDTEMTEEYLLAWNDHHATFFSAMSDLVTGGVFICRYSKTL